MQAPKLPISLFFPWDVNQTSSLSAAIWSFCSPETTNKKEINANCGGDLYWHFSNRIQTWTTSVFSQGTSTHHQMVVIFQEQLSWDAFNIVTTAKKDSLFPYQFTQLVLQDGVVFLSIAI